MAYSSESCLESFLVQTLSLPRTAQHVPRNPDGEMSANDGLLNAASAHKRSRATHTKSRRGCYSCKSRRVKCDEAKPICGACELRGGACVFPKSTSRQPSRERRDELPIVGEAQPQKPLPDVFHDGSPHALDFDLQPPSVPNAEADLGPMNMLDLRLMSHYMMQTSKRMSLNPYRQNVWETIIPGLAAQHEFLMHLLLGLAGLDHFFLDTESITSSPSGGASSGENSTVRNANKHLQIVVAHHQCGLQGFRDQLSTLSDSNCHRVFAGSLLLVGFAFASLRVRNWSDSHMPIVSPYPKVRLDWIFLIRGLTTVVKQCWTTLKMGPFRGILQYPGSTDDWKMSPDSMFTSVTPPSGCSSRLFRFCQGAYGALSRLKALQGSPPSPMTEDSPRNRIYPPSSALSEGLDLLESIYMRILYIVQYDRKDTDIPVAIQADLEDAAVMSWPQMLSEEFLASLGAPDVTPNAFLVILAHLYLTLSLFEALWYLNGAFDEDIMKIDTLFKASGDPTFIELMAWPVSVLNG